MITHPIADGVIDVHAHWLPRDLFDLPGAGPHGQIHDWDGQLYVGEIPLSIATASISDVDAILEDMDRADVGVRVLSAPPFAFSQQTGADTDTSVDSFNEALTQVLADTRGSLLGFGLVTLGDPSASTIQLEGLARTEGIAGVAVPPLVDGQSLDGAALRHILAEAGRLNLAVLVHPTQLTRPEWNRYYLANLIGNPVESATAVASLILSGIKDAQADLRICFVHGGGCAPGLLGRWNHGWSRRADVRADSARPPRDVFAELFFDTVTHDPHQLQLLCQLAGSDRVICGSDYPFDMAEAEPVRFALEHGPDRAALIRSARKYLGLSMPS